MDDTLTETSPTSMIISYLVFKKSLCFLSIYYVLPCLFEVNTVKLGNKERFDKEQIGIEEPIPVTNLPFSS